VNQINKKGETPIFACKYEKKNIVKSIIQYGTDINIVDNKGNTPLLISCYEDNDILFRVKMAVYLVKHEANLNNANHNGKVLLHELYCYVNGNLINYYIKYGVDVNKRDNKGNTPLSIEHMKNNEIVIKCLIENE